MTRPDPREWFPQFYANPAIGALAPACRWTISGRLGEDGADQGRKAPVDVRHMLAGCTPNCRHEGPLRGAFRLDSTCLMDLGELTAAVPLAALIAFSRLYLYLHFPTDILAGACFGALIAEAAAWSFQKVLPRAQKRFPGAAHPSREG